MTTVSIKRLAAALRARCIEHDNEAEAMLKRAKKPGLKPVERAHFGRAAHGYVMRGRECLVIAEGIENGWPPKKARSRT